MEIQNGGIVLTATIYYITFMALGRCSYPERRAVLIMFIEVGECRVRRLTHRLLFVQHAVLTWTENQTLVMLCEDGVAVLPTMLYQPLIYVNMCDICKWPLF